MTSNNPTPALVRHACAADSVHGMGADCCPFDAEGYVKPEYNGDSETVVGGEDVTMGGTFYGKVLRVIPPLRYSGDTDPRYLIRAEDGRERIIFG